MIEHTIGPYQISDKLGEGGMGEVYRARDTNLHRDVAIKVLPHAWAGDADRLARFRREAQLLASLNHPHIAQIYGIETNGAAADPARPLTTALVMELIEGPTLADRIAEGPLPVSEAVAIARQIADALDAAHEHGVVHRDLKPANIKVREDGTVKILDFGLAKAMGPAMATSASAAMSPTLTSPALSQLGMILGTAAYMSPEQARGKAVDKRTDIWAFGCVLFEMLAGRRPFEGEDVTEIIAGVVKTDPAWVRLPPDVPPRLVRLLRRCLEKDPRQRLRDIGDARVELTDGFAETVTTLPAPPPRHAWRERGVWLGALVLSIAIGMGAWVMRPLPPGPGPVTRFSFTLPEGQRINANVRRLAVSPDGTQIVFSADGQLYRRALDDPELRSIPGTSESPAHPEFSDDGRSIVYTVLDVASQRLTLKRIPAAGGTPVKVADLVTARDPGGWTPPDVSLVWSGDEIVGSMPSGIWAVPARGGTLRTLVQVDPKVEVATLPRLINNGRHVLFTLRRVGEAGVEATSIVAQDVANGSRTEIVRAGRLTMLLPSGYLVYLRGTDLMAVAFDEPGLRVTGDPVPVASGLASQVAMSRGGTLAYQLAAAAVARAPVWVNRGGKEEPIGVPAQPTTMVRVSPDGTRLAMTSSSEIRVLTFESGTMARLSEVGGGHWDAAWTHDSRRLVFSSGPTLNAVRIVLKAADGSGAATVLTPLPGGFPNGVSSDGKYVIFHRGVGELMVQPVDAAAPARRVIEGGALNAAFSPDGRWIAYQAGLASRSEVHVIGFPNASAGRSQVSSGGGRYPVWSPDGRELFFIDGAGFLTAVTVDARSGFATGPPRPLFRTDRYDVQANSRPFDISHDGKRFVFAKPATDAARPTIHVVINWLQEVMAKVGAPHE